MHLRITNVLVLPYNILPEKDLGLLQLEKFGQVEVLLELYLQLDPVLIPKWVQEVIFPEVFWEGGIRRPPSVISTRFIMTTEITLSWGFLPYRQSE